METNTKRIAFLDMTKFFAIFCVILGHATVNGHLYEFIYSFHMPLFMVVSGYFMGKSFTLSPILFLKKKAIQLLLPVLTFSILFVSFHNSIYTYITDKESINFFQYLFGGWMWFLKYLFICLVIAYACKKIFRNDAVAAILPTIILLMSTRATIFKLLPFLWLGYFLCKYNDIIFKHSKAILAGSFVLFIFFLSVWNQDYDSPHYRIIFFNTPIRLDFQNLIILLIRLGVGAFGSLFFITLIKVILDYIKTGKFLQLCCSTGRNTLGIYCIQIYILEFGLDHLHLSFAFPGSVFVQVLYAIAILVVCDIIVRFINKNKWTALFMLGHSSQRNTNKSN